MKVLKAIGGLLAMSSLGCASALSASTRASQQPHECDEAVPTSASHVESVPSFKIPMLAGEYRLVMVSQRAEDAGRTAEGRLTLWPTDSLLRSHLPVRMGDEMIWRQTGYRPLWGSSTIDLSDLGAMPGSSVASSDPMAPGVLVEGRKLQLGVGTLGSIQLDGSTTVLELIYAGPGLFRGTWWHRGYGRRMRDGVELPWAFGYFCALRIGESSSPDV